MSYEAIVIGTGLAGLVCALRVAEAGGRVLVIAKGAGSTHLAPACVDVLGYAPERVDSPAASLPAFAAARPEHPYARVGADAIAASLAWYAERLRGLGYVGGLERNRLLPTALGVPKPSALVPAAMAGGDLRPGTRLCVVGLRPLRDFHAALLADNLNRAGLGVRARALELDPPLPNRRPDENALGLARRFDDPELRARVAGELAPRLEPGERVAFPAVLGSADDEPWRDLEARLERPVFEVPTLPPSVPGIRAFRVLRERLRRARGRIIMGAEVVGPAGGEGAARPGRLAGVRVRAAARERVERADFYVLASGGWAAGGLELDSRWQASEPVLGLPLAGVPGPGEARFSPDYFASQPLARAGVPVDDGLRPLDAHGERVYDNVLVAGATLAGAEPWKEASGNGIALATAWAAGEVVLGARTRQEAAA